ncbi:MAG: hypothetical protein AB7O67_16520 [Vicinamibacterales bacterium]
MGVTVSMRVEAEFSEGVWTEISTDLVAPAGPLRIRYGITGNGPTDCVASTGSLEFVLRNDAGNSGATQGWYSPAHASRRSGWTYGLPIRVVFTYGTDRTKFRGKVWAITPEPGAYRSQRTAVAAFDVIRDLGDADVREIAIQVDKSEDELLEAILDAIPVAARPPATDIGAGVDVIPYAFDDIGSGAKALSLARDVVVSSLGLLVAKGDGTLMYRSRHARGLVASAYTFTNSMHGLSVPSSQEKAYNRVRVTTHPKTIDATATTVLYALTGTAPAIGAGQTLELWGDYRDPGDTTRLLGGIDVVDPLVAGTDYAGNAAADGSGANLTANLSVAIDPFASSVKFTVTNTGTQAVHLVDATGATLLQCRGKRVLDDGARTFEASLAKGYGDRPLPVDMPYQDSDEIGKSAAAYLLAQYSDTTQQIEWLEFLANYSDDFMTQALDREPGDRITVTETMTGLTLVDAIIQRVDLEVTAGPWVVCRWGLAPASPFRFWQWGIVGASEWGETTVYGF